MAKKYFQNNPSMPYQSIEEEEFIEKYEPLQNPLTQDGPWNNWMFETYGEEHEIVLAELKKKSNNIWTLVDGDNVESIIISGYHWVNRQGYIITKKPYADGMDIEVWYENLEDLDIIDPV